MTDNVAKSLALAVLLVAAAATGCSGEAPKAPLPPSGNDGSDPLIPPTAPPATSGGEDGTFDHENDSGFDPWELLNQLQDQGPPEFAARLHGCPKMKYGTFGAVLRSVGVNTGNATALSAGKLYTDAASVMGAPNYAARAPEAGDLTTSSAAKMFDIWVAAAPEIAASLGTRCTRKGQPVAFFDAQGKCTADGISCLIGVPASAAHVEICNAMLGQATTPDKGKTIAISTLASAAHTCE